MSDQYVLDPATKGKVVLETTAGPIDIELFSRECPLACRNFVQLCMEGYYNGCEFHRLVRDFIVQTGDPSGTGHGGESIYGGDVFKTELHQRLKFRNRGYLGMASDKKDQNMSQFFFTLGPAPELSGKHTLFGKVTGKTIFNLTKLNEYEVDKNERPSYVHKITGAKILENPFNDIKPRKLAEERKRKREREEREKPKKSAVPAKKNTALLSFGDEMDEEEEQISHLKLKGKSAHDVLDDEFLSRQAAVEPEELGAKGPEFEEAKVEEDQGEREQRIGRIKEKFSKPKSSKRAKFDDLDDEDLDQMLDDQKEAEKKQQMEEITSELKQLQKEYKKSMRVPKADKSESDEAGTSGGMKMYNKLKLKFKSGTKDIVKTVDPKREEQTIALLDRFRTKLDRASVHGVLWDKKVDMSDQKTQEEVILATSEEQGKIDLDAEDIQGEDWMDHELHAPEDTSGVTKARDANRKEEDDEWYPINDPRNKLNVRRRTQGGQVPDLFANAEPMAMP